MGQKRAEKKRAKFMKRLIVVGFLSVASANLGKYVNRTEFQITAKFNDECRFRKEIMKHCIRIRTVCGDKEDVFSGSQVVANHPNQLASANERSSNTRGLARLGKSLEKMEILKSIYSSSKFERLSAVDTQLIKAVSVVKEDGPFTVTIKNPNAKCSSIRVRWWKFHCRPCLDNGNLTVDH